MKDAAVRSELLYRSIRWFFHLDFPFGDIVISVQVMVQGYFTSAIAIELTFRHVRVRKTTCGM